MSETVTLAHGGGGLWTNRLLERCVFPALDAPGNPLTARGDSAQLPAAAGELAISADGFVVRPPDFPGGDIGKLAVIGSCNDLVVAGAAPRWLTLSLILEEGLPLADLERWMRSARAAADAVGAQVVAGDTKVVERGKGDAIYITTTAVGVRQADVGAHRIAPGDEVWLSGDVGRHGIAVMAVREGLGFETALESDCAHLGAAVAALSEVGAEVHAMRDLTRGGLAAALVELARDAGARVTVDEQAIPVGDAVAGACELLGLDPLEVACEGRLVAFVAPGAPAPPEPFRRIGRVDTADPRGRVELIATTGVARPLDLPSGLLLPRIC